MSVKVPNNRFICFSLQRFGELYQHIRSISDFEKMGEWLVAEAETAQGFRQAQRLENLGTALIHLPIAEYQHIGQYYLAWCDYRKGINTERTLWNLVENSRTYRGKALISIATMEVDQGDLTFALKHCTEAMKYSDSPSTLLQAARSVAVVTGLEGSHRYALKRLETIFPLAKYVAPKFYYQYLNSYAVELGHAGRIEEAQNVCRITLASPYINAYPEWRETGQDLALRGYRSRSSAPVIQSFPGNILPMPQREPSDTSAHPAIFGPAGVRSLQKWKEEKMVKESNGDDDKNLDEMNDKDLFMEIMRVASQDFITSKKLRKMVDAIKKIASEKD